MALMKARPDTARRLDHWRAEIERSIIDAAGGVEDDLLNQSVTAAVDAFFDARADVRHASATVAPLLERIGEQQARRGFDADDLTASFRVAHVTAQKGLASTIGDHVTRDTLLKVRQDLVTYLSTLYAETHISLVRTRRIHAMTPQQRREHLGALAFSRDLTAELEKLAIAEGVDPDAPLVAVVSVSAPIPAALRRHPRTLAGESALEVLVPEDWGPDHLAGELTGQAVTGPATPLTHAAEAVILARQAAQLLRNGTVVDLRPIVPCSDLLGHLVAGTRPLLAQLIIDKHLGAFETMPPVRQVALGELALGALESGAPIDQVARALGIPRQTAHSRMKTLRRIFGDALHDPTQRLELIVAFRAALPRWRATLTG